MQQRPRERLKTAVDAIAYIERHLTEEGDLQALAEAAHYSKFHLQRLFADVIGLSPHAYAKRRRLTEAARLLALSDQPILEIALSSGYESQQAFTSTFREFYKQTPHQFRKRRCFYPLQNRYDFRKELDAELRGNTYAQPPIALAGESDIPGWMELVRLVAGGYPMLEKGSYREALAQAIREGRALLMKDEARTMGAMIMSPQTGSIDFLGIHPLHRKQGISGRFLERALEAQRGKLLFTTTYRQGDKADPGFREEIRRLGFVEAELLVEFGYPTQKMIYQNGPQEKWIR